MKERPILFSTEMVKAILEGRKTQTRRIIKKQPHGAGEWVRQLASWLFPNVNPYIKLKCPYGQPGDRLWVRETWALNPWSYLGGCKYIYRSDYESFPKNEIGKSYPDIDKWRPSIFMPREACRILLEVTDVRVERLQDITEEDAKAEGITDIEFYPDEGFPLSIGHMAGQDDGKTSLHTTRVKAYAALWESINGEGSWEKNPWVWVISFERIQS